MWGTALRFGKIRVFRNWRFPSKESWTTRARNEPTCWAHRWEGWWGCGWPGSTPERVDRLVLAGSMAHVAPEERIRLDRRIELLHRDGPLAFARAMMEDLVAPAFRAAHIRLMDAVVQAYALEMPSPDRIDMLARLVRHADLRPHLGEIAAETLILHGGQDQLISVQQAGSLARALPSAHLEVFPDAGHHVLLEKRAEVPSRLFRFLVNRDEDHGA